MADNDGVNRYVLGEANYPARLLVVDSPPKELSATGSLEGGLRVAIVGSRTPHRDTRAFAKRLAREVVRAGGIVVSGGANGIDAAAHEGALTERGRTWLVSPTGYGEIFPDHHQWLYDEVSASEGSVVYPFKDGTPAHTARFLRRNHVLVALSDVVVIVQAGIPSGTLNAAKWARQHQRPLWIVAPPPWLNENGEFAGSELELSRGALPLCSIGAFLKSLQLSPPPKKRTPRLPEDAQKLLKVAGTEPKHLDELVALSGVPAPSAATALLTLALEDVVVEGPPGFFRRGI